MNQEKDILDEVIISMSLEAGSTIRVKISGWSMWPLVGNGAVLIIIPDNKDIKKGDIILFRSSGRMVAHRVIKACLDIFTTKGDASTFFDPPVQRHDIIGRAVFMEGEGRRTAIDSSVWRLLSYILACYSCACGVIFGKILNDRFMNATRRSPIADAFNLLLPMFIYILTRRL